MRDKIYAEHRELTNRKCKIDKADSNSISYILIQKKIKNEIIFILKNTF